MSKVFTIAEGLENMGALRTGGQGSVYKGRRIGPIISAVKILPTPIHTESTDDKNYRNFKNEVDKLKKVNEAPNPNVVKILNSGITESGSFPFIEMEFIEGPDLEELLKPPHEAIFTIKETIKVADQLANALCHCHKVGVKHGDIKSNNVKFNIHSGNYVLLDFGLSVMSDEQRRSSMRHAGAIEFMAPEQNEGKMLFQTDVYSYGVILYELLAGQVPFPLKDNGETARNTVMIAHMESPLPDLLELRRQHLPENWTAAQKEREMQVPVWLLDLIADCLEKSPENRYSNGIQLQEAIIENSIADNKSSKGNSAKNIKPEIETSPPVVPLTSYGPPAGSRMITLSKPVFYGFMVLLFVFMALAGYSLFSKSAVPVNQAAKTVVDTPKTIDTAQLAEDYYARKHREKQKLVDSTTLNAIKEGMNPQTHKDGSNPDSTAADTTNKQNN
ncbi:serine/threonine-protein kinase [Mucilaginibacter sp.]|uniref:serine/threonine protein kinase n=1 Tax=Mucilaginibacter sp. TaxID=1882438 RepID=UPI00284172D1|nr:serine/threonine-protein kinase [Mucilaginibacter sp.]MDR3696104.1 serine/threonine-protein kinase [Mucilaginibacter sp.]